MATIDESKQEFHIAGRHLTVPKFYTPSGKAQFKALQIDEGTQPVDFPLRLISGRSEGQFNTIVYEEVDTYRNVTHRNTVLMNPDDMAALSLAEGDTVELSSPTGTLTGLAVKAFDIQRGAVLGYYPETNPLVGQTLDPHSQTPAYKSTPIRVRKAPTH